MTPWAARTRAASATNVSPRKRGIAANEDGLRSGLRRNVLRDAGDGAPDVGHGEFFRDNRAPTGCSEFNFGGHAGSSLFGAEHYDAASLYSVRTDDCTRLRCSFCAHHGWLAEEAERLAHVLVDDGLAACVNLVPGVQSIYRWRGAVESADEVLLLIKTTAARLDAVEAALREAHSYEVPEFLVLTAESASQAYLAWLLRATEAKPS